MNSYEKIDKCIENIQDNPFDKIVKSLTYTRRHKCENNRIFYSYQNKKLRLKLVSVKDRGHAYDDIKDLETG